MTCRDVADAEQPRINLVRAVRPISLLGCLQRIFRGAIERIWLACLRLPRALDVTEFSSPAATE
jgi:hypothetical protein